MKKSDLIWRLFALSATLISVTQGAWAIDIAVVGSWAETIDAGDLMAGAGSNLQSTYESASDQVQISISGTSRADDTWRVDVKRVDTNWHSNFALYVRRTGTGTGGNVSGGTTYQAVTIAYQAFFSGSGNVSAIPVQLKLEGMSISVPPGVYSTTIYYMVVDT